MSVRRMFWAAASPVVWVMFKLGWLSRKWVNVCCAARHKKLFGPLWHYRWFGDSPGGIPRRVSLAGCGFDVTITSEGSILFCDDFSAKFWFYRNPNDPVGDLWRCESVYKTPFSVGQFIDAYDWVRSVYGGSFEIKEVKDEG